MLNGFWFLCLFVVMLFLAACSGEKAVTDQQENSRNEWTEVRAENFVLSIPKDLTREDVVGSDGYAARYSNALMTVSIESRAGSETISDIKRVSQIHNLTEEPIDRDRMKGIRAAFQFEAGETNFQDKKKAFVRFLGIDCKWSAESAIFMVLYQNSSDSDTADKILDSVKVECSE